MTQHEYDTIKLILSGKPWLVRDQLEIFLKEVEITEKETRTSEQNRALHKWFGQIAQLCQESGIDAKVLMSKTMNVEVTPEIVKEMWRVMQSYLYGKRSTTELEKQGQIDTIVDHFVRFFGERFELVLPPFPSKETKYAGNTNVPYPDDYQPPTI